MTMLLVLLSALLLSVYKIIKKVFWEIWKQQHYMIMRTLLGMPNGNFSAGRKMAVPPYNYQMNERKSIG